MQAAASVENPGPLRAQNRYFALLSPQAGQNPAAMPGDGTFARVPPLAISM
ncbi:hypothetical protein [Paraburkholderia sp.]|nr:hypothetical protein [Paraburkholderia sp.]